MMLAIKWKIFGYVVFIAFYAAPPAIATLPAPDGGEPIVVIDMHTHVFNARDLPLAGILSARGATPVLSRTLAKLLNAWTSREDLDGPLPGAAALALTNESLREGAMSEIEASIPGASTDSLFAPLSPEEREELLEFVGEEESTTIPMLPGLPGASPQPQELEVVARALQKLDFPPSEVVEASTVPGAAAGAPKAAIGGYMQFLGVMLKGHLTIARLLESQEYPQVDLFVHHMMDLEKAYASEPAVSFEEQMIRMSKLDGRFSGKFVHFVAFDPFRRSDALASVKRGLAAGAIGVKFYPPSGYRPIENEIPPRPSALKPSARKRWNSRYGNQTAAGLNQLIDSFFAFAERTDVPIFTHCSPGGFEAEKGYGHMGDPKYWAKVLEKYPKLRLCFGHSGGQAYWFPVAHPTDAEKLEAAFGEQVVRLCRKFENVYCEVGYLESIIQPTQSDKFKARLREVVDGNEPGKNWREFGNKLMYGTDWHMIHKETDHKLFPQRFAEVFQDDALKPWMRPFFAQNAIRFLKLEALASSDKYTSDQRDRWKQLIAGAYVQP